MRNIVAGFFLGYLVTALLVAPPVLQATRATHSYSDSVVLVLKRSGVLRPIKSTVDQATEFRDRMLTELVNTINSKF